MRAISVLLLAAAVPLFALDKRGVALSNLIYFQDAAADKLVIELKAHTLLAGNECADKPTCAAMYALEYRENFRLVPITRVDGPAGTKKLTVSLEAPVTDVKALVFVARDLKAVPLTNPKKIGYLELPVKPQLMALDIDDSEAFEGIRGPAMVQYQALLPDTLTLDANTPAKLSSALSVTDPGDFDRPYRGYIANVFKESPYVYTLVVRGGPRGKKLNVQVGGVETFGGAPLNATTAVQTLAIPKGRDDATLFLRLGAEANDIKQERKYTLDVRAREAWLVGDRWQMGPTLDVTVGNKTAAAPNTGALSADFRYFIPGRPGFRSRLLLAPIFRTDRAFENENLGIDVAWEMIIPSLDKSLEMRRKEEKRRGGPPLARVWGWSVRPVIALETGRHLKSSSPEVDDETFSRLRGGVALVLERGRWKLSGSAVQRQLFSDEVLLQSNEVVEVSRSEKRFFRGDLTYDFGTAGLTLTYLNGRQPPAYSPTDSTSLGVTFKF
jgi:hypothetical protein